MQAIATLQSRASGSSTTSWISNKRELRKKPRARTCLQAHASIDGSLSLLTRRIEQLKASERQKQWPGFSQWRGSESSDSSSPWRGYGEWRTRDQQKEQRMQSSLRHRLSKPPLAHGDLATEEDNFSCSNKLEEWHRACWKQFEDCNAFNDTTDDSPSKDS